MKASDYTKKTRMIAAILTIMSIFLCIGPAMFYTGSALLGGAATTAKVGLVFTVFLSIVLSMICLVKRTLLRSSTWLLCIGLWLCLENIVGMLMITAACQVTDELIVAPLARRFREKARTNFEIDKRFNK